MDSPSKRKLPPALKTILQIDVAVTELFCNLADKIIPPQKCRRLFKVLEISCHAFPWISLSLALLWILWKESLFQLQVNLIIALVLDLIIIAIVKAAVRRRRPKKNQADMFMTLGPDVYSFPSGHTTRAILLGYIFTHLYPLGTFMTFFIYVWLVTIAISRVLMRRHHLLDIVGGIVLGFLEGMLVSALWLSESTSLWLVGFLSEESLNLEGLNDGNLGGDEL